MSHSLRILVLLGLSLGVLSAIGAEDKPKEKPEGKFEMTPDEKSVLELTNAEREKNKLPPLKPHPILFKVARAHSANMAKQDKLAHELDGKEPWQRVQAAGYKSSWVGENVAAGEEFPPKVVVHDWMESKPHRENILNATYVEIGIGIATSAKGELYYTQVFTRLPKKR
jgi:uncharacterized protein YkwD